MLIVYVTGIFGATFMFFTLRCTNTSNQRQTLANFTSNDRKLFQGI